MKYKSAQISIFVILGMIILLISILLINSKYEFKESDLEIEKNIEIDYDVKIKNYVESCLERQSEHALNRALFENGNYTSGTATQDPNFPVLLNYDLWFHNFDVGKLNRDKIAPSMNVYLEDTFYNCYDVSELNNFYENLNITEIYENPKFVVEVKDNIVTIFYNQTLKIINLNTNKESLVDGFNYKIKNVPIATLESDVNDFLGKLNQYLQSVDGKTDGNSQMEWGNQDSINPNILNEVSNQREDLFVYVLVGNSSASVLYHYKKIWRPTYFYFTIQSNTLNSINESLYYNNVVHRYHNNNEPFNDKRVIIEK